VRETDGGVECVVADEAAMVLLGGELARACAGGEVIFLEGELGMGKTTLARGLLRALGHRGAVKSPTYTLVEPYELAGGTVYHFDLYRLGAAEELEFMGIRDYFGENATCLVEWPERGLGGLPAPDIVARITRQAAGRCVALCGASDRGQSVLARWRSSCRRDRS